MRIPLGLQQYRFEPGSWLESVSDVAIGSFAGSMRAFYIMLTWVYVNMVRPIAKIIGITFPDGKRPKVSNGKIKVAAVGFGRTGTVRCPLVSFYNSILCDEGLKYHFSKSVMD
jgi:hypothetical protein